MTHNTNKTIIRIIIYRQQTVAGVTDLLRSAEQRQRRRQRERQLVDKNNSFACPARAFFSFVPLLCRRLQITKFEVL